MAQNDIHTLLINGSYCTVPVSISLAYRQEFADPPNERPGRDLIESWFTTILGPWFQIRQFLTDDLIWECATSSYGGLVDTVFLQDAKGTSPDSSTPSTVCAQFNIPPLFPHENGKEGRFYLPGIRMDDLNRSGFSQTLNSQFVVFAQSLLSIQSAATGANDSYRLVPHGKYRDRDGLVDNAEAFLPYVTEFVKVLGSRRADACGAFVAGGGGEFKPIIVPPVTPP